MSKIDASACTWFEEGGGEETAARAIDFLDSIGIETDWLGDEEVQRVDGMAIIDGRILVAPDKPLWPGDLLHEGGHVAVCEPESRPCLGPVEADPTDEFMAIGWSFAAAREIDMPLAQLFHKGGYRQEGQRLIDSFATGHWIGAPMLAYYGMTELNLQAALAKGVPTFPGMIRWLR